MNLYVWGLFGLIGLAAVGGVMAGSADDVFGGGIGMVAWALFAFGSRNIEQTTSCCTVSHSEPAAMWFGIGMTGISVLLMIFGSARLLDPRNDRSEDAVLRGDR